MLWMRCRPHGAHLMKVSQLMLRLFTQASPGVRVRLKVEINSAFPRTGISQDIYLAPAVP